MPVGPGARGGPGEEGRGEERRGEERKHEQSKVTHRQASGETLSVQINIYPLLQK